MICDWLWLWNQDMIHTILLSLFEQFIDINFDCQLVFLLNISSDSRTNFHAHQIKGFVWVLDWCYGFKETSIFLRFTEVFQILIGHLWIFLSIIKSVHESFEDVSIFTLVTQ